jgi:antitoxin component of RelBE/YafQ-DinJ toxin-antitoxin module
MRIESELKQQAVIFSNRIGIPLSTLIQAYLREITETKKVQFSLPASKSKQASQSKRVVNQLVGARPRIWPDLGPGEFTSEKVQTVLNDLIANPQKYI